MAYVYTPYKMSNATKNARKTARTDEKTLRNYYENGYSQGAGGYKGKLMLYIYENPGYGNTNQVIEYYGYPDELDLYAYLDEVSVWNVYGGPSSQATILPEDMRPPLHTLRMFRHTDR